MQPKKGFKKNRSKIVALKAGVHGKGRTFATKVHENQGGRASKQGRRKIDTAGCLPLIEQ